MLAAMEARRLGQAMRAIRLSTHRSQTSVAQRAGISQSVYSRAERGEIAGLKVSTLAAIAAALEADLILDLRYRAGRIDRLIDRAHAALVEHVVRHLGSAGWEVVVEFSFNVFGERGSVDVLAWHAPTRTLLIVEVKSRMTDLQNMLMSLGRKLRLVPDEVRRQLGWDPLAVGRIVVTPGTTESRAVLAGHRSMFDASLPSRAMEIRRWLRSPHGPIAGVWLVSWDVLHGIRG
jgi:transcriptional regulator with XRE-family HTH domain